MQGKGFRDRIPDFTARNTVVIGVSCDSPPDNRAFRDKFDFPFDLLCDVDRAVSMRYGAAAAADTVYPSRISYLLDPRGQVARVYGEVDPGAHPDEVLRELDGLD